MSQVTQAVLFDLDGTLVDTARDLGAALNHVLAQHALPPCTYEAYREVASHGVKGLLQLGFGDALAQYNFDALRHSFLAYYQTHNGRESTLFPTGHELLAFLREKGIPWGIVTNKPYRFAAQLCKRLALTDCKILIGGDSLAVRKPNPTPLWVAAQCLKVPPKHCWYLGDAERDIESARRAGMHTVLARYGYLSSTDDVAAWHAEDEIQTLVELRELLQKSTDFCANESVNNRC